MLRGKSVFAVTNEEDDGWRQASQIQRRPQPRRITVGDFLTTTSLSNKYGALQDNTKLSKKCRQSVQPTESRPTKAVQNQCRSVSKKPPCVRTILSTEDMTMDELDKIIMEEEAKLVAILQNDAENEVVSRKCRQSVQPKNAYGTNSGKFEEFMATTTTPVPPYPP